MQSTETTPSHRTASVVPELRANAPWRVLSVAPAGAQRLRVVFVDGTKGEIDLSGFLKSAAVSGSVFEPLRDPSVFQRASILLGAVQWPGGAELAPDAAYDAIRRDGIWKVPAP